MIRMSKLTDYGIVLLIAISRRSGLERFARSGARRRLWRSGPTVSKI